MYLHIDIKRKNFNFEIVPKIVWLKIEQFLIMWLFFVIYRKQNRKCLSNSKSGNLLFEP